MKKVLFIVKTRISYGISYGLLNSAKFVAELLNTFSGVEAQVVDVADYNQIDRVVTAYRPDNVIIEALWVVPKKFDELIRLHPNVHWLVRLHSNPAFIANEGIAFDWIAQYIDIGRKTEKLNVSVNTKEFCNYLHAIYGEDVPYTPNYYPNPDRGDIATPISDGWLHIGLFGALRPMKNHLAQALAAIRYTQGKDIDLAFHINSDRIEQRGDEVLKNLRALFESTSNTQLIEHPWTPHDEFISLVASMDIGMQVSLTETFNIVAADFVSSGIPILVSPDISWAPMAYKCDPVDLTSMSEGLDRVLNIDRPTITCKAKERLVASNDAARVAWKKYLRAF